MNGTSPWEWEGILCQLAVEGLMQKRLLQCVQRNELPLVDGREALGMHGARAREDGKVGFRNARGGWFLGRRDGVNGRRST